MTDNLHEYKSWLKSLKCPDINSIYLVKKKIAGVTADTTLKEGTYIKVNCFRVPVLSHKRLDDHLDFEKICELIVCTRKGVPYKKTHMISVEGVEKLKRDGFIELLVEDNSLKTKSAMFKFADGVRPVSKGDIVCLEENNGRNSKPVMAEVLSVGSRFLTVVEKGQIHEYRFNLETGKFGDGYIGLPPRLFSSIEAREEIKLRIYELGHITEYFKSREALNLSLEQIRIIKEIINIP